MFHNRKLTVTATATAIVLALSACAQGTSDGTDGDNEIALAGVAFNATDPFWITFMCGGTKAANAAGVTLKWYAGNTAEVSEQQTNLDAALLKDPDAIIIGASASDPFSAQVEDIQAAGVPVIAAATDTSPNYTTVRSGTDNAEFIDYVVNDIGETGTLGILAGIPGDNPWLVSRWQPLVDQLATTAPGITVLAEQYTDFDRNKATAAASALITGNPDLTAIYAVSGPEGEGAAAAVEEAGKSGQIKVYSYDATPAQVEALRAGTITALLAQPSALIGAEAVKAAVAYVSAHPNREPVPAGTDVNELALKVLDKDNVDKPESADYIYAATCKA